MFPTVEHAAWLCGRRGRALYDLASSDLRAAPPVDPVAVPPSLASRSPPPAGVSVQTLLATAYGVDPERVLVTAGSTHANFLAMATALEADERSVALVEKPGPELLAKTPAGLGARVDRFVRDDGFALDPARVAAALRPETGLAAVTNRHDPSGRLTDRETLAAVADAVAEAGGWLLVDERYAPYVPAGATRDGPFGGVTAAGLDRTVVTNSLSYFHGLPDVQVGWLVGPPDFVAAARRVADHVAAGASTSVALAGRALYAHEDLAEESRALLGANAETLADYVAARDGLRGVVFEGCPYAYVEAMGVEGDALARAAWEAGLLVVPGGVFGAPGGVRVSLVRAPSDVRASLAAFDRVLADLAH